MQLLFLALKKYFTYFLIMFLAFVLIGNITLNYDLFIDGVCKITVLALLLTPFSLIDYFGAPIAHWSTYNQSITLNREINETFKISRNLLKTMSEIKLTDSNEVKSRFHLESSFSKIVIQLKSVDETRTKLIISSTPKVFHLITDFDKYIKDVKNIILTLELNIEEELVFEKMEKQENEKTIDTEFNKAYYILYYRLMKTWIIFIGSMILYSMAYYFYFQMKPEAATLMLFGIFFLYMFHIFTFEVTQTAKLLKCSDCGNCLIDNPYNILKYKNLLQCEPCNIKLKPANTPE